MKIQKQVAFVIILIFLWCTLFSVLYTIKFVRFVAMINKETSGAPLSKTNVNIFKDTEAWELAVAVKKQDANKIKKIAEESPALLDVQDPLYDVTPLIWAIGMEKYKSAEALLECGADPNIVADCTERFEAEKSILMNGDLIDGKRWDITSGLLLGETALYIAAGYSWVDNQAKKDARYVTLLLQYGADPNIVYIGAEDFTRPGGTGSSYGSEIGRSPLMNSVGCDIDKTKALVEGGADINHKTKSGRTAAIVALELMSATRINFDQYPHYLIAEKKAIISDPYYTLGDPLPGFDPNKKFYPVTKLRNWFPELDSDEYKMKLEVIEEFSRQGVDYHATRASIDQIRHIKRKYPDTWEEYLKRY